MKVTGTQHPNIQETTKDIGAIEKHIAGMEGVADIATFVGKGAPRFLLTYSPEKPYTSYGLLMVCLDEYA